MLPIQLIHQELCTSPVQVCRGCPTAILSHVSYLNLPFFYKAHVVFPCSVLPEKVAKLPIVLEIPFLREARGKTKKLQTWKKTLAENFFMHFCLAEKKHAAHSMQLSVPFH
jgi:hypothetical protein